MNSAGLSSICHGTNGLNGSAWRAILKTFEAGLAPGDADDPVLVVGAHAPRSSPAMAAAMTGHRTLRANMNLFLHRKADADDRAEVASASPRACACTEWRERPHYPRSAGPLASIPRTSNSCSTLNAGLTWQMEEVRP